MLAAACFPSLPPRWSGFSLSLLVGAFLLPMSAHAESGGVHGEVAIEFHSDWTTNSDDPANERGDTNIKIEAGIEAELASNLKLKSLAIVEPVLDPAEGEDRFFDDEGLYLQEFFAEYEGKTFAVRAGKFGQKFGVAWDSAPGIWGTDFAEDYEMAEQIGVAADLRFGSKDSGAHVFTVGTFFADTSFLSQSALTNRGRTRKSDGGPGNTEDFSSFSVALEGGKIPALTGLHYHLAYIYRDAEGADETAETGLAAAVSIKVPAGAVALVPLIEYVALNDTGGTRGTDVRYLTTSLGAEYGKWNVALSRTARETASTDAADVNDSLFQVSAGYVFDTGIGVNVGWRQAREEGVDSDALGLLVDYAVQF